MPRRQLLAAALGLPFLPSAWAGAAELPSALPDAPGAQATTSRVFASDAGMILNTIKADKTADFEAVVAKVKDALHKANTPERTQQAASWRVFRAVEPGANNSVLYVFWMDPPVKDADYTVSKIVYEAYPSEAQALYKQFSDAYAGGQTLVNLKLVSRMSE